MKPNFPVADSYIASDHTISVDRSAATISMRRGAMLGMRSRYASRCRPRGISFTAALCIFLFPRSLLQHHISTMYPSKTLAACSMARTVCALHASVVLSAATDKGNALLANGPTLDKLLLLLLLPPPPPPHLKALLDRPALFSDLLKKRLCCSATTRNTIQPTLHYSARFCLSCTHL